MSGRFPLQEVVFPPLRPSQAAQEQYEKLALLLRARALRDYDEHCRTPCRPLDPTQWKAIKTRGRLTVYRQLPSSSVGETDDRTRARSRTTESREQSSTSPTNDKTDLTVFLPWEPSASTRAGTRAPVHAQRRHSAAPSDEWPLPTLLQLGSLQGSLDDVMYGVTTRDAQEMLLKSSYTRDEIVDAETLCELQGPTPEEPFRFLGIKWVVKTNPPSVRAFVWPRDLVFLEATGILVRPNGERLGYHLMHSVDAGRGFEPLRGKRIVRARMSSCYFFRQTTLDAVDVFMKANLDPSSSAPEGMALHSAAMSLTYCWKAVICAQNKKLTWLLTQSGVVPGRKSRRHKRGNCTLCSKSLGAFARGSKTSCRLCHTHVCADCRVKRKLSFPGQMHKQIKRKNVVLCTSCVSRAQSLNTFELAALGVRERELALEHQRQQRSATIQSQRAPGRATIQEPTRAMLPVVRVWGHDSGNESDDERIAIGNPVCLPQCVDAESGDANNDESTPTPQASAETDRRRQNQTDNPVGTTKTQLREHAWDIDSEEEDEAEDSPVVVANAVSLGNSILGRNSAPVQGEMERQHPWDFDSEAEDEEDDSPVVAVNAVSLCNSILSGSEHVASTHKQEEPLEDSSTPAWDIDSEAEDDEDDSPVIVVNAVSLQPVVGESTTSHVVHYAWQDSLPSPSCRRSDGIESWPSPPSSPLGSPTNLPAERGVPVYPPSEGESALVWQPPTAPKLHRLNASATPEEVMAQFAELCDAAEDVYQTARKNTLTHLEPSRQPSRLRVHIGAFN